MNTEIKLPGIDKSFGGLVQKELVTLKKEFDDRDYARVYEVIKREGNKITVAVLSEIAINGDAYSQRHNSQKDSSFVGKTFGPFETEYFEPYM